MLRAWSLILLVALLQPANAETGELKFAEFDRCELERGGAVEDCRIGYRTLGQLAADGSNAVLVPTWYTGTSEGLEGMIG